MTIDEAIKICEEDAEKIGDNPQSDRHAERCRQLAEWLMELKDLRAEQNDQYIFIHELMMELKEAKRLLKAAINDFELPKDCRICNPKKAWNCIPDKFQCLPDGLFKEFEWRHKAEALKLIGETNDEP